ncbi:MAG: flagellar assembly protein FliW [Acidobacteriota bacterium]
MITINEQEYHYDASQILNFAEGLIGFPEMRRAVLIPMEDFAPFSWLASIESDRPHFVVVDPNDIFLDYQTVSADLTDRPNMRTLAIVKISSDWKRTTVNLRAPIFISSETNDGAQLVLSDGKYGFEESIPQE